MRLRRLMHRPLRVAAALSATSLLLSPAVPARAVPIVPHDFVYAPRVDYNGDGYGDLAITVPYEHDVNAFAAGAVAVLYGGPGGLQGEHPDDQLWNEDSPGVEGDAEADEDFGHGLASYDFDGDGYADLAIGVPGQDVGPRKEAGAVHVFYGSPSGLQTASPAAQYWTQDSQGVEDEVEGYDHLGWTLAAGDFDGDGNGDLVMGAEQEGVDGFGEAGAVNVLYGSPSGLQTIAPADQFWNEATLGHALSYGAGFGATLAVGDFNGDGRDDLVAGMPDKQVFGFSQAGAAHVIYGSKAGLQTTDPAPQFWSQDGAGAEDKVEAYERFADALAAGDFDGNGFDDLAVGVPEQTVKGRTNAGFVQVFYGTPIGLRATHPDDQIWSQNSVGVKDKVDILERFGSWLSSGDWNADGRADLSISIAVEKIDHVVLSAVEVMYGTGTGIQATWPDDQLWTQNSPDVNGDGGLGLPLLARDLNGDQVDDLAVGNPYDRAGPGLGEPGTVSVLFGALVGLQAVDPHDQLWSQESPGVQSDAEDYEAFGALLG
jgi:hypothetical protein